MATSLSAEALARAAQAKKDHEAQKLAEAAELRAVAAEVAAAAGFRVICSPVADGAPIPAGSTKVHFIRHGEGHHNVAQKAWRLREEYIEGTEPWVVVPAAAPDPRPRRRRRRNCGPAQRLARAPAQRLLWSDVGAPPSSDSTRLGTPWTTTPAWSLSTPSSRLSGRGKLPTSRPVQSAKWPSAECGMQSVSLSISLSLSLSLSLALSLSLFASSYESLRAVVSD